MVGEISNLHRNLRKMRIFLRLKNKICCCEASNLCLLVTENLGVFYGSTYHQVGGKVDHTKKNMSEFTNNKKICKKKSTHFFPSPALFLWLENLPKPFPDSDHAQDGRQTALLPESSVRHPSFFAGEDASERRKNI